MKFLVLALSLLSSGAMATSYSQWLNVKIDDRCSVREAYGQVEQTANQSCLGNGWAGVQYYNWNSGCYETARYTIPTHTLIGTVTVVDSYCDVWYRCYN